MTGRAGVPLAEQAYQHLKEALLSGEYRAGERLSVERVGDAVGASRQPAMDAIRRLESEGLLTIIPQVGTLVPTVGVSEARDFFHFLATTEGHFGKLAAERATKEEITELAAIVEDYARSIGRRADGKEVARRYRLHNRTFHGLIHQMARSRLAHQVAVSLWDKADLYVSTVSKEPTFAAREKEAVNEHRRIAKAIARRDGERASAEIVPHVLSFADGFTE